MRPITRSAGLAGLLGLAIIVSLALWWWQATRPQALVAHFCQQVMDGISDKDAGDLTALLDPSYDLDAHWPVLRDLQRDLPMAASAQAEDPRELARSLLGRWFFTRRQQDLDPLCAPVDLLEDVPPPDHLAAPPVADLVARIRFGLRGGGPRGTIPDATYVFWFRRASAWSRSLSIVAHEPMAVGAGR